MIAAVLGATTLTGCASGEPGAAAIVGEDRLTVAELQDEVEAFGADVAQLPEPLTVAPDLQRMMLQNYVHHALHVELAEQLDIEVSGSDIDTFLDVAAIESGGDLSSLMASGGFTEETLREAVYDVLVREQATATLGSQEDAVSALLIIDAQLDPWVNPRYGSWDAATLEPGTGSIAVPAQVEPGQ